MNAPQPTPPDAEAMREDVLRVLRLSLDVACRKPLCGGEVEGLEDAADALLAPGGPIASERDRLVKERDEAETQNEALHVKLRALAPHGSCACSYDLPGDVCGHHSPALLAAEAEIITLKAEAARKDEEIAGLRAGLEAILPSKLCGESWGLPDTERVAFTATFGGLRAARAALNTTQNRDA